ncbi:putative membrane protein [[Clostridium] sordellii VPI 9048]|nr:putative membrane protein [[Clostridium] sordellii VPI 9048] [Paeniclostridium sordellii VPI 9048]
MNNKLLVAIASIVFSICLTPPFISLISFLTILLKQRLSIDLFYLVVNRLLIIHFISKSLKISFLIFKL